MSLRTFSGDRGTGRPFDGPGTAHRMACWANEFGWRFSIAAIPSEQPFSVFVGVDRSSMLLDADGSLGAWRKDVQVFDRACVVPAAEHGVMFALRGGWRLNDLFMCSEGQGVGWSDEPTEWKAVPVSDHALMMVVRLVRPGLSAWAPAT